MTGLNGFLQNKECLSGLDRSDKNKENDPLGRATGPF
jgi:hypothetical protein